MQRFNSFNMIHKALRALLYDTALSLQQTYFADSTEAEAVLTKVETVIHQFEQHAYHEDNFVLPAIAKHAPHLVESFENEHEEDHELGNKLRHLLNMFRGSSDAAQRIICGSALTQSFREFMIFNLEHMAKEEVEINKVLWEHYSDEELMQINAKIVANIPEQEKAFSSKWMMRGVNKAEAIDWLKSIKKTAPPFAFQALYNLTNTELPENIRTEVQDAVTDREVIF